MSEKVTVVPGMSPFLQRNNSLKLKKGSAKNMGPQREEEGGEGQKENVGVSVSGEGGEQKYKHVIKDAENNVARLAGVMQNAELELEKAFRRTGDVQKGYTSQLETQTEELKKVIVSKQAQIAYLEDKVGNMRQKYGEKLSASQTKISTLEQELRRYKHAQVQERNKIVEKLKKDMASLNAQVSQLKQSKLYLERQMKHLSEENCTLKEKGKASKDEAEADMFSNVLDQSLRGKEMERELLQCKKQLELERKRSIKLQRKLHKLRDNKMQDDVCDKYKKIAEEMRVPYKEQLMEENKMLRNQLLGNQISKQDEITKSQLAWMRQALNSGEFNGSVCGNSWTNDYRDMFYS